MAIKTKRDYITYKRKQLEAIGMSISNLRKLSEKTFRKLAIKCTKRKRCAYGTEIDYWCFHKKLVNPETGLTRWYCRFYNCPHIHGE